MKVQNWQQAIDTFKSGELLDPAKNVQPHNWPIGENGFGDDILLACGFNGLVDIDNGYPYDTDRLNKVWVTSWVCTDTRVGLALYVFDGEVVAVSSQQARKANEDIEFLSAEAAAKVAAYIRTFISEPEYTVAKDLLEPIDERWFSRGDR